MPDSRLVKAAYNEMLKNPRKATWPKLVKVLLDKAGSHGGGMKARFPNANLMISLNCKIHGLGTR